ncbi:S-adenosylmethionine-dependent methyltransferase KNAG_0F03080 [Huiozyma naganishii CBS 8797]|uniref:Protein N-terminal and lysine N-methyltransferase EFM7 n=1 Tax=Huiozyma naganishii (strain ATCC MYA-139 / BCRC 22969 / CBS 8797 / KCTC 17520 / NBRC 10181 / NCYC 3082 / Yp74L-3) TaxID=1071383 RepID=J7R804_HUIN7|nr:hypothetical protein KNAG_0F03080 [Kazachstania naganishii CBS 8797]CCK70970.1 hypothetical protein KNAG_0F03080 [Kazachstania naganishii CBS 8797]
MSDVESLEAGGLFEEPEGFLPPPPEPHYAEYDREMISPMSKSKQRHIDLKLVGSSPLWGHLLWNSGIYTAKHLDKHPELVLDKNVLELGAAGALPSVVAGLIGAKRVVSTDYPDADLMSVIRENAKSLENVSVEGYIWGNDYSDVLSHLENPAEKFQLVILSDLVFNHTEHHKLLKTTRDLLSADGKALVVFSPHRPWLLDADLAFFETAKNEYGFDVERIEMVHWKPMFEEDDETVEVRSRVYAYYMSHPSVDSKIV